jgi:hypothetical protein
MNPEREDIKVISRLYQGLIKGYIKVLSKRVRTRGFRASHGARFRSRAREPKDLKGHESPQDHDGPQDHDSL